MSRLGYVARHPKRALTVLAALGASGAIAATGASFVYDTETASTEFKAGKLVMTNSGHQTALVDNVNIRTNLLSVVSAPGGPYIDTDTKKHTLANAAESTFNAKCKVRLTASDIADGTNPMDPTEQGNPLEFVRLGIGEYAGGTNTPQTAKFNGGAGPAAAYTQEPLAGALTQTGDTAVGEFAIPGVLKPGESRDYHVRWFIKSVERGADNKYQGSSLKLKAEWLCDATRANS